MAGCRNGRIGLPTPIVVSTFLAFFLAVLLTPGLASAQNCGPDEAFDAAGSVTRRLALTQAQKSAIYYAVLQQHARGPAVRPGAVTPAVGAPVSPAVELAAVPDAARDGDLVTADLKYAMVADQIVIVDPVRMRVVDVIDDNALP